MYRYGSIVVIYVAMYMRRLILVLPVAGSRGVLR